MEKLAGKTLCHQSVLKHHQLVILKRAGYKHFGGRTLFNIYCKRYDLLVFNIFAIYRSQTWESRPEYSTAFRDTPFAKM